MDRLDGFMKYNRQTAPYRPVSERIHDYNDINTYLVEQDIYKQAARCMDCGIPFCHSLGCPLNNIIPDLNKLVSQGRWEEALRRLENTNMLPEITGRICPALCEAACTLSINNSPVTIKQIELAIIEKGYKEGWVKPIIPKLENNKRIAIIGSGPSGLAAAQVLRMKGYDVTVFEKSFGLGGILRYGIPNYKLEKWVIDRRIELMRKSNIKFETDVNIGEDISYRYLKTRFDAILLTTGVGSPRDLQIPGREAKNIHFALDYLQKSNCFLSNEISLEDSISVENKSVVVIGGGDTGSDCVGIAIRQKAKEVLQIEIMPKPKEWNFSWNPEWPLWPMILRTSSSHEEGAKREWSILTKKFIKEGNKLCGIHCSRLEWIQSGNSSSLKMVEIPGSDFIIEADLVLLALGFVNSEYQKLIEDIKVDRDEKGNIKIYAKYMTSVNGVFAAGDVNTGISLVVKAIFQGRESAKAIDEYLSKI